jgi:hypothetical protein
MGVFYDASRKMWRCQWRDPETGKRKDRTFSERVYGSEGAREAAERTFSENGKVLAHFLPAGSKNDIRIEGSVALMTISMKDGSKHEVLLDPSDVERTQELRWRIQVDKRDGRKYVRHTNEARSFSIFLHRHLTGANEGTQVDHRNGNGLDNRRFNIRVVTQSVNQRNRRRSQSDDKDATVGVYFHQHSKCWIASWQEGSIRRLRSFSVNKYGDGEARRLAEDCRARMTAENGYLGRD